MLKGLHAEKLVGTYSAAVVIKEADGKVRVKKDELGTRHGAWTGIAVGAVVGILFPPSIIGSAAVLGVAGGVAGHLWHGMSRSDVKELGEALDEGEAALIVIGESRVEEQIEKAKLRAVKQVEKQIDANADELKKQVEDAAGPLTPGGQSGRKDLGHAAHPAQLAGRDRAQVLGLQQRHPRQVLGLALQGAVEPRQMVAKRGGAAVENGQRLRRGEQHHEGQGGRELRELVRVVPACRSAPHAAPDAPRRSARRPCARGTAGRARSGAPRSGRPRAAARSSCRGSRADRR